jgi:hypothetical protein
MKHILPLLLGAALLGSSGCTYRYIYSVSDTPVETASGQPSTILGVTETKFYAIVPITRDVYYECGKNGTQLDCTRLCDVKNEEGKRIRCTIYWQ